MKFIITEEQHNSIQEQKSLEKKSDMIFDVFKMLYPDYEETYLGYTNETEVKSEDDELLFFFRWGRKEFLYGVKFIENIEGWLGPLDDEINSEYLKKVMTVFAKRHFGWDAKSCGYHWY
jgi:hypothetical protein